jgi:hypothetical protein
MIGRFHERAVRDAQVLREFAWQVPAEASAMLRGADLAESCTWSRKSRSALDDRFAKELVYTELQFIRELPDIEITE